MSRTRTLARLGFLFVVALVVFAARQAPAANAAPPTDLLISEYIEGSSNNKALEIYNGTGAAINLATGGYEIFVSFNGGTSTGTFALTGTVANGDVFVFAASSANATILAQADQTTTSSLWNGNDFIALRKTGAVVVDSLGVLGTNPGTEWGTGLTSTADNTLQRKDTVCEGDTNTTDAFDPATEWNGFANDTFTGLGSHTANCGPSGPVINEMQVNTASTDWEFVEIYGPASYDLSSLTLIGVESDTGTSAGTVDTVISLAGQTIPADGFWVAASPAGESTYSISADLDISNDTFENSTATYFLVSGFTGAAGNDLDTDNDGTLDTTPWTAIIDSINIRDNGAGDFAYGAPSRGPDGSNLPSGVFRCPDGGDFSSDFHNFSTPDGTPGVSNGPLCGEDVAPTVTSTTPANGATNVPLNANIQVTFSEPVTVSGAWYTISCSVSGSHTATVSGGPTTYTLDPNTDFAANETCTVTIVAAQVADQDGTADNMAANYVFTFTTTPPPAACGDPGVTLISAIQGATGTSPNEGTVRTVEAIVVGDFQDTTPEPPNELNGYFLQEEDVDADGNANTSEGIFVFEGNNPTTPAVAVGDKVRVTGTVVEFGDAPDTYTELVGPLSVVVCSGGNTLPTAVTINLPVSSLSDYEKYESMRVTFPQELTVTEVFTLGRFGEVLLSANGRLWIPTHEAEPGAAAAAVEAANILRSITLDDGLTNQNPDPVIYPAPELSAFNTLRGGDTTTGLTGVLHYLDTTEDFRVQPVGTVTWNHENPRPTESPVVGGDLKVVGSNTLNYFTTVDQGPDVCGPAGNADCRGADSQLEFERQHDKLINMLIELDADIVGLNELENNAAANPANDGTDPVLESIVDALNDQLGPGTYDFIDAGAIGTDAIKVGLIYKPDSVTPVGSYNILTSSYDPDFVDTLNRPVLAQTFEDDNGAVFTVAVAHLKSKGSGCGAGDDQPDALGGNCNGTRTRAAEVMVDWFAEPSVNNGDPDILLVGDLNSYRKEDPIDVFVNAGYVDLANTLTDPYSYVFDGEWGYLDYAMASETLAPQVTGVAEWHINADEPIVLDYDTEFKNPDQINDFYDDDPFRVSDHDPMVVGLTLDFVPPPLEFEVFISSLTNGTTDDNVTYGPEDILLWDSGSWSKWFEGEDNDLEPNGKAKHNINAFWIPDPNGDDVLMSFTQNARFVNAIPGKVDGMDVVMWDGQGWSLVFDGQDVGLTVLTKEKIDALHVLDDSMAPPQLLAAAGGSCLRYMLISTAGDGRVPGYNGGTIKFDGTDVLGFCQTAEGPTTAGKWIRVLNGKAEGLPGQALTSLSASPDGDVLYLTTKKAFNADGISGTHSTIYAYDFATGELSGPYWSAPAEGLNTQVNGLHGPVFASN